METPAFILWALEHICPPRGFEDGSLPERVERQLRAARAVSDAHREDRIFEGLCFDPPCAFKIDESLTIYGGIQTLQRACRDCPANASPQHDLTPLAGCFGLLPLPTAAASSLANATELLTQFPSTTPPWFGLWLQSPLGPDQAKPLRTILTGADLGPEARRPLAEFIAALHITINRDIPLHLVHYPPGRVEGRTWRLVPHCPRCKASWPQPASRHCQTCSYNGAPAPDKKRLARGQRPYFPLDRLLGPELAAATLKRYLAFRAQRESTPQARALPQPAPPDSPPAD